MEPPHGATTWSHHHMEPPHGATTWSHHMEPPHGATTWSHHHMEPPPHGATTWSHHHMEPPHGATTTWSHHHMEPPHGATTPPGARWQPLASCYRQSVNISAPPRPPQGHAHRKLASLLARLPTFGASRAAYTPASEISRREHRLLGIDRLDDIVSRPDPRPTRTDSRAAGR
jgi:hypothetical protein